jgi:hypothetical protein
MSDLAFMAVMTRKGTAATRNRRSSCANGKQATTAGKHTVLPAIHSPRKR